MNWEEYKKWFFKSYENGTYDRAGCGGPVIMACMLALFFLCSCKSTEYVPVVETHTEHHWHTDSVKQVDSVLTEKTTLIREVDSATMAQYGIRMKAMEKAWLIQSDKLQKEISRLESQKSDTVIKIDSVPKIVIKEVEKERSLGDKLSTFIADAVIGVIIFILVVILYRLIGKRLKR